MVIILKMKLLSVDHIEESEISTVSSECVTVMAS